MGRTSGPAMTQLIAARQLLVVSMTGQFLTWSYITKHSLEEHSPYLAVVTVCPRLIVRMTVYAPSDEMPYAKVPCHLPPTPSTHVTRDQPRASGGVEICGLFLIKPMATNTTTYGHICSKCRKGPHPASECKTGYSQPR